MCYTASASLFSLTAAVLSCTLLFPYDRTLATFFLFVALMQVYDYIFWQNSARTAVNYWTTKLAMLTNLSQPLMLAFLAQMFIPGIVFGAAVTGILVAYACVMLVFMAVNWSVVDYTRVAAVSAPSLLWKWNYAPGYIFVYSLYFVAFLATILAAYPYALGIFFASVVMASFILTNTFFKRRRVGRLWCHIAGFLPIVFLLFGAFEKAQAKQPTAGSKVLAPKPGLFTGSCTWVRQSHRD